MLRRPAAMAEDMNETTDQSGPRLSSDELVRSLAEDFSLAVEPGWADVIGAAVSRGDRLGAET